MSDQKDGDGIDKIDFSWGAKRGRGGKNKEVQFYESFTFDGVHYSLYDSVYLFKEGESKPYIGKLIKIWEHSEKERKVKVLWFFHPSEISNYLGGVNVLENELFLASGVGKGLANVNPLESIAGKCNVVCISKNERNRQPSAEELHKAHYVFYRTFNVDNCNITPISEKLDDKIAMIEVNFLLNKSEPQSLDLRKVDNGDVTVNLEKLLTSIKDSIAEDGAVECDASGGSSPGNNNKGDEGLLDLVKDAAGPDEAGSVVGLKRKQMNSGDNKQLKRKSDTAGLDNLDPVACSQKFTLRSPNSKKKDANESLLDENATNDDSGINNLDDCVSPIENGNSKLVKGKHRPIGAVAKGKTHEQPSKKSKSGGTSLSSDNGGTSTKKLAIAASKKASTSIGISPESVNRDQLTKEVNAVGNGFPKTIKAVGLIEDKSNAKFDVVSGKQYKNKPGSAAVSVASSKASQPAHSDVQPVSNDAETDDERNVCEKLDSTGNGLKNKLKSNSVMKDKSIDEVHKVPIKEQLDDVKIESSHHANDVTPRPPDRSKWFTVGPWEDRLKEAHEQGKLVLLHNLSPSYTSSEVEDIIWHGFKESCTAKVIQRTASSNRFSGQAFVIFKTREVAEKVLRKLDKECLMLPNKRPLVGSRGVMYFPGKNTSFPGHLVIDKLRHQMQREAREAVSTSHSAQPNTLEYEMAIEWRLLQDRADLWWKMLHKRQGEEFKKTEEGMKSQEAS